MQNLSSTGGTKTSQHVGTAIWSPQALAKAFTNVVLLLTQFTGVLIQ